MQERRKYVRLNIALEVGYAIKGEDVTAYKSITKNISPNGARFTIEKKLPKGTILDLEIKIPSISDPIPIKAKIIWSQKDAVQQKDIYDAGFEFVHIPEQSKDIFFQYLCNLMYEQLKKMK